MQKNINHLNPTDWGFPSKEEQSDSPKVVSLIVLAVAVAFFLELSYLAVMLNMYIS